MLQQTILPLFNAILQLFMIGAFGAIASRKKWISTENIQGLSKFTVYLFLPALIFSNNIKNFNPDSLQYWWLIPIGASLMCFTGIFFSRFFFRNNNSKNLLTAVSSFQNAAYLLLPIGLSMYPDQFDQFTTYIFLIVLGFNPTLWSIGKVLVTNRQQTKFNWKEFITPPLIAIILSITIVLFNIQHLIPKLFTDALNIVGQATVPSANLILGAIIGTISIKNLPKLSELTKTCSIKFMLIPLIVCTVLYLLGIHRTNPLLAEVFVLEAAAAPATNLMIQVKTYGGNSEKLGGIMLFMYIIALIMMPVWYILWNLFINR